MPNGEPGSPDVRANTMSCVAWCSPELNRFCPLITHSSPSGTAVVSRYVASEPWFGSVSPNASRRVPSRKPGIHSARCSAVPKSRIISTVGKLPMIELSFCRSLCSPRPLAARCSRMIAISRFAGVVAAVLRGQRPAQPARGVGAAAHLARAAPPSPRAGRRRASKSVRAYSRRWSKNRMLSSACSSGRISRSMNASIAASVAVISAGISKSTCRSSNCGLTDAGRL